MNVQTINQSAAQVQADVIAVGIYQDGQLTAGAGAIDQASGGILQRLWNAREVQGKLGEIVPLYGLTQVNALLTLVVGLGARHEADCRTAFQAAASAARAASNRQRQTIGLFLDANWDRRQIESAVAGLLVGSQGQDLYRSEKKRYPFTTLLCDWTDSGALQAGQVLGESVNLTRRLVNEPPQVLHPATFAEQAVAVGQAASMTVDVWDEERLQDERCGAMLAVARGSTRPPRLVTMRYQGASSPDAPWLALAGKGVTFDSGGLSLKPSEGMKTMKCDMAGAATVLGALNAIARLKLPVNVLGMMGLVENMPGGNAFKLGDVLTARNGRTIEVHNTDAEGRLVLADVLSLLAEQKPARIIDLATLTGACVVALGLDVAGVMSNNADWQDQVLQAAERCGERAWPLPMFAEYGEQIQAEVADIKNVGEGRWGGAITAAKFLEQFVDKLPWTHIDIAGPAFLDKPKPWLDAGGSGAMVRTLVQVARSWGGEESPT